MEREMKPNLEEYQKGATTWKREHKGIMYTLSHHGISDYRPEGTWCYYIHLHSNLFINDEDFKLFDREPEKKEMSVGSYWETYDYNSVPDYGFHGGITYYSADKFMDKTGEYRKSLKIGCDYAHLWDQECGYYQGLNEVDQDCKKLIDELVSHHPVKLRCQYSGLIDNPDKFYKARNGNMVHNSKMSEFSEEKWPSWLPE